MKNIQIFAKALLEQIEVARVRQLSGLTESSNIKHADTAKAISLFQKYTGLDQTGIPDPKTMHMIKLVAEDATSIGQAIGQVGGNVANAVGGAANAVGNAASGAANAVGGAANWLGQQAGAAWDGAKNLATGAVQGAQNLAAGVQKGYQQAVQAQPTPPATKPKAAPAAGKKDPAVEKLQNELIAK
jgi:hypothetical protein